MNARGKRIGKRNKQTNKYKKCVYKMCLVDGYISRIKHHLHNYFMLFLVYRKWLAGCMVGSLFILLYFKSAFNLRLCHSFRRQWMNANSKRS